MDLIFFVFPKRRLKLIISEKGLKGKKLATVVKRKLSGSTDGRAIKVVATSTPGTTIHTAVAGQTAGTFDEIWIYAVNSDTVVRNLTVEFGGTTSPDDDIQVFPIQPQSGLILVVPGLILQNGSVVKAFASSANVVTLSGFVNSIVD